MKKLILFLFVSFLAIGVNSQPWLRNLPKTKSSKAITFADYQKAFYGYWKPFKVDNKGYYFKDGKKVKAAGWKQFKRWEWNMAGQIDVATQEFPKKSAQQVYDEFYKTNLKLKGLKAAAWTAVGPSSSGGGYAGVGRINCIAFHPSDNNTYWVGAPAGGIWQTTDNGANWTCLTNNNDVLGVSDIIIPSNYSSSNTIYIATGDRDASDNRSIGVLKSTDGGTNWISTDLSFTLANNEMVYKLLLDPSDDNTIIAATSNGVYKTTNGGTTWSTQLTAKSFKDMEYKPGDFNTLYGSNTNGEIYVSINGGTTWSKTFDNSNAGRIELAVTPANTATVYALAAGNDNGLYGVYKSINSGSTFVQTLAGTTTNLLGWASNGGDDGGQGWYDLSLAVSPTDANTLLVGGVNNWRSTNGGTNWSIVSHWSGNGAPAVHADKHNLRFRSNGDVFECNDGGVYISTNNGTNWTDKTNGMVISQMYKLGVSQTVANEVITGLQDNGTKLVSAGTWDDVKGGDGMECLIDYTNANIQYGTYVNGQISRTINHWSSATNIEPNNAGSGAWVTPYVIDPNDAATLYAGYSNVWKTTDRGNNWTEISSMNTSGKIRSMAISSSNNSVLYVADNTNIWKTTNGGTSWTNATNNLPVSSGYIKYITVKNDDENTAWVAMSGYNEHAVYQTTNGGTSWTNISTGLPEIPAYSVVQNKQSTGEVQLYVGTELGIYYKAGSNNWVEFNTGLPNVKIGEIEIFYDVVPANSKLYVATYGRGLWETIVETPNTTIASVTTDEITNLNITSATTGGNVADEGATSVTERGIVWNLSGSPTISDTKVTDAGAGTGTFTTSLTGLTTATTYYAKAYATNSHGTAYGNERKFTTLCNGPSSQATNFAASTITDNTATISWTSGGDHVIVIVKETSAVDSDPFRGTTYSTNADITLGENIGSECIAVYSGTDESITVTNLNEGTKYHFAIYKYIDAEKCYNITAPAAGSLTTTGYCRSFATESGDSKIDKVVFNTINVNSASSGCETYTDNTSESTKVTQGMNYSLSVTVSTCNGDYKKAVKVFIDWNGDKDFEDVDELVYTSPTAVATTTHTTNISIPSTHEGSTRMRIVCTEGNTSDINACGSYEYGETEDYTVVIEQATTSVNKLHKEMKLKVFPNPTNGIFIIEAEKANSKMEVWIKDINGKTVLERTLTGVRNELDLSDQSKGIYFITIKSEGKDTTIKLILK